MKTLMKTLGEITFSFGENWTDFLKDMPEEAIEASRADIVQWLGQNGVKGRSIIDIGCGSGLHSMCFHQLGARCVTSFDCDPRSVQATCSLWERLGKPSNWRVLSGSVLDKEFFDALETADVVYSWGVLHHTGAMWEALETVASKVKPGGHLWISLYTKGPRYPRDLARKRAYNRASRPIKRMIVYRQILKLMLRRLLEKRNPFSWNQRRHRGMDEYHDLIDWLGGLPYEVASPAEVAEFAERLCFVIKRQVVKSEGGCSIYLLQRRGTSTV